METIKDFLNTLPTKSQEECTKSLRDYLISIWYLLKDKQDKRLTPRLIVDILEKACFSETPPFDKAWRDCKDLPRNSALTSSNEFQFFKEIILFQIADLDRIEKSGMLKQSPLTLYGGIKSPSGHSWYSFSPLDFVECATAGFDASCNRQQQGEIQQANGPLIGPPYKATEFTWINLAHLMQYGQLYE